MNNFFIPTLLIIIIVKLKKNNAFVTSCWGGYQGLTFDPLASYSATGMSIPLTNQTINFKVKYTCPSTSTGCYVLLFIYNIL
jgi:hypothetical protein